MAECAAIELIRVELVYASAERQERRTVDLPRGSTVAQAIEASGIAECMTDGPIDPGRLGISARRVTSDHVLAHGDRVEIYRPLMLDPKEARRKRARHP